MGIFKRFPFLQTIILIIFSVIGISSLFVLIGAASCRLSPQETEIIRGNYSPPHLDNFVILDSLSGKVDFSRMVRFSKLEYFLNEEGTAIPLDYDFNVNKTSHELTFPQKLAVGDIYTLNAMVIDEGGSTLSFSLDFAGYNENPAYMIFSEVNGEASSKKKEFVEFYVLKAGNLGGMIFKSAYDGPQNDYMFPAVEVQKGEYIVLHLRTSIQNPISELGTQLNKAIGPNCTDTGRDLFALRNSSCLGKDDVLLLYNRLNGDVFDALLYARSEKTDWGKERLVEYAHIAYENQIWKDGEGVEYAVLSDKTTSTRTLSRQNIGKLKAQYDVDKKIPIAQKKNDWIVVKTGKASPGIVNSTEPYQSN